MIFIIVRYETVHGILRHIDFFNVNLIILDIISFLGRVFVVFFIFKLMLFFMFIV